MRAFIGRTRARSIGFPHVQDAFDNQAPNAWHGDLFDSSARRLN